MYLQDKIVYGLPTAADIDNHAYKLGEGSMIIERDYTIMKQKAGDMKESGRG